MTVSFIIAYHNEPLSMLHQCLQSIEAIGLPHEEHEVLLIDDGSDTAPQSFLHDKHPAVRYIRQENSGLSGARNNGIERAKGDYIQFVDSDDCLIPGQYRQIVKLARDNRMDMLMFRFSTKEESMAKKPEAIRLARTWTGPEYLCHNNLRPAACMYIFRRELLGDRLRFEQGILHEDVLFTPQLILKTSRMAAVTSEAYYYRQHPGTITSEKDDRHISKRLQDMMHILLELKKMASSQKGHACQAMLRVVNQQTMVLMYETYVGLHDLTALRRTTKDLSQEGLFPLPLKFHTLKYWVFALLSRLIK